MTDPHPSPPPGRTGPGCAAAAIAVPVAFGCLLIAITSQAGLVLGGLAVVGAFVLLFQRDRRLRAVGAGLLAGYAVALLLFGACVAVVASSI